MCIKGYLQLLLYVRTLYMKTESSQHRNVVGVGLLRHEMEVEAIWR